ncbi:MAG: anaerobic sulfatase maturase [Planctomycetes bacterium]|nr:anaerobic sulfatase maturase [Planctomycetota bacterium]
MLPKNRPFNIMAKPVCGVCNLACEYCYYLAKPAELYPGVEKFLMSGEVLESHVRQYMAAMPQQCDFGWQGGEPTLAGLEFFEKVLELQRRFAVPGQAVSNALQTNATLLDDRWCEFLARNKFLVGVSLDGPPRRHDHFRHDKGGRDTFHRAWAGLEKLAAHGCEFNVLVTLNSANAAAAGEIYRYLVNRSIRYVQFIPILERRPDGTFAEFSCTCEQFTKAILDVFEQWAGHDAGKVSERLIDNVIHTILFGRSAICCHATQCAAEFVLEWNGDLYACDHFVQKDWLIGNIMRTPLVELVGGEKVRDFARLKTELPDDCKACEYLEFCNAGCPKHHVPIGTSAKRVNYYCSAYKAFFAQALPELRRMAEYFRCGEIPPPKQSPAAQPEGEKNAAAPANRKTARGQAVPGRNAPCPCGSGKKFKACCGKR